VNLVDVCYCNVVVVNACTVLCGLFESAVCDDARYDLLFEGMMPMAPAQQAMRAPRPMAQQPMRAAAMSARPITGQQPVPMPQQRPAGKVGQLS
jgi:hypothetical protein